jgi:hypothetical protein
MAAPHGNLNGLKNGRRMARLVLGELPKPLFRVKMQVRNYRRQLEDEVTLRHGSVGVTHAHFIDTAVTAEQHAAICRWLLNQRMSEMSTADVLSCSGQILKSKDVRNRAIARLDLDGKRGDDGWQMLEIPLIGSPETLPRPDGTQSVEAAR